MQRPKGTSELRTVVHCDECDMVASDGLFSKYDPECERVRTAPEVPPRRASGREAGDLFPPTLLRTASTHSGWMVPASVILAKLGKES